MKTYIIIFGILVSFLAITIACDDNMSSDTKDKTSKISQRQDQSTFDAIINQTDGSALYTDPFDLDSAYLEGSELYIVVSYSGGCEKHDFELIWPEAIFLIYPPQFDVVLTHNNNGEMCEAYPTDTLIFDLTDNPLGINPDDFTKVKLGIVNASNPDLRIDLNQ